MKPVEYKYFQLETLYNMYFQLETLTNSVLEEYWLSTKSYFIYFDTFWLD